MHQYNPLSYWLLKISFSFFCISLMGCSRPYTPNNILVYSDEGHSIVVLRFKSPLRAGPSGIEINSEWAVNFYSWKSGAYSGGAIIDPVVYNSALLATDDCLEYFKKKYGDFTFDERLSQSIVGEVSIEPDKVKINLYVKNDARSWPLKANGTYSIEKVYSINDALEQMVINRAELKGVDWTKGAGRH